jgi:hypothetical protein
MPTDWFAGNSVDSQQPSSAMLMRSLGVGCAEDKLAKGCWLLLLRDLPHAPQHHDLGASLESSSCRSKIPETICVLLCDEVKVCGPVLNCVVEDCQLLCSSSERRDDRAQRAKDTRSVSSASLHCSPSEGHDPGDSHMCRSGAGGQLYVVEKMSF